MKNIRIHTIMFSLLTLPAAAYAAPAGSGDIHSYDLAGDSFRAVPGYFLYNNAHMKTDNGATLDADTIKANLDKATNRLTDVVATGHVKAYAVQEADRQSYTITSDKAIYDPKTNRITFPDPVVLHVFSKATSGPVVQTGNSAVVQLGNGPDYPQLSMTHVHTTFTPVAPPPASKAE